MSREKGQTLVEFALILPVLLLTLFVIIESGRIFQAYVTVQHSAREGTRYAVTGRWNEEFAGEPDPRVSSIEDVSRNALAGLPLEGPAGYDVEGSILIGHYEIKVFCQTPSGGLAEGCAGKPNEKVAVQVAYRLQIVTPILNTIAPSVEIKGYQEMINEDFGRLGGGGFANLREPPSPIPPDIPTAGASPTPTETSTGTITPTPTETGTPTGTPTATSTPACKVQIQEPVNAGDSTVTVRGDPGDTIVIRDLDAGGATIGSAIIGSGGFCNTLVGVPVTSLVDGHIIIAISSVYPSSDTACVGGACWPTSTATATATQGPTATPTPKGNYIVLSHACINEGEAADITVYGYNWSPAASKTIVIEWDGTEKDRFSSSENWNRTISISASDATTGTHTVRAVQVEPPSYEYSASVVVPCPPTPTPTPTATPLRPDLIITDFTISPGAVITAYVPVTFTTVIYNQGLAGASTLFWVDLYIDPVPAPPTAGQSNGDVVWEAASFLGVGETSTVTLNYALPVTGTHVAYGYVDTRMDITEIDETNNASLPLDLTVMAGIPPSATMSIDPPCSSADLTTTITVSGENWPTDEGDIDIQWNGISKDSISPPQLNWSRVITINASEAISGTVNTISAETLSGGTLITSTSYIPCSTMGRIDGYTWIFVGGDIVPHGRVAVYCYDSSNNLIAQVTSDGNGYYDLGYIPTDTYTVIGETFIDAVMYLDTQPGVVVSQGSTVRTNLLLLPQY